MSLSTTEQTNDDEETTSASLLARCLLALRRSFFLSLFVLGLLIFVLAATIMDGDVAGISVWKGDLVLAAMMGIWGGTFMLLGGTIYGGFWILRNLVYE